MARAAPSSSSRRSRACSPGSRIPAYDASKAAIAGLCRQVAAEGARRGVRANVVAPGLIDTPLGALATEGRPSRAKAPVPLGRQGTAWEVADPVVFLLSDDAALHHRPGPRRRRRPDRRTRLSSSSLASGEQAGDDD